MAEKLFKLVDAGAVILDDEFEEPSRKDLDSMLESGANGKPGVSRVASSGRGLEDYDFDDL